MAFWLNGEAKNEKNFYELSTLRTSCPKNEMQSEITRTVGNGSLPTENRKFAQKSPAASSGWA
jgi:hypothetical protein